MALRGVTTSVNNQTSPISVACPSGVQAGDLIIIEVTGGFSGSDIAPTFPSGFAAITGTTGGTLGDLQIGGGSGFWTAIAIKTATGSEPGSYSISSASNELCSAQCWAFSGRSGTITFVNSNASTSGTSPVTLAQASGTAAAGDDVLALAGIQTGASFGASESFTAGAGFGNATLTAATSGSQDPPICGQCATNVSAGAVGTIAGQFTDGTIAVHYAYYVISMAAGGGAPSNLSPLGIGAVAPLAWVIRRRQILARERNAELRRWRRDETSGLFLPEHKKMISHG